MDRGNMIARLRSHGQPWDVAVIGGGATGLGVAIDAASRGLHTVLLEGSEIASLASFHEYGVGWIIRGVRRGRRQGMRRRHGGNYSAME